MAVDPGNMNFTISDFKVPGNPIHFQSLFIFESRDPFAGDLQPKEFSVFTKIQIFQSVPWTI